MEEEEVWSQGRAGVVSGSGSGSGPGFPALLARGLLEGLRVELSAGRQYGVSVLLACLHLHPSTARISPAASMDEFLFYLLLFSLLSSATTIQQEFSTSSPMTTTILRPHAITSASS